jgi:hypothetical protein
MLALMGLDYLFSWSGAVRKQRVAEATLNAIQLPAESAQGSFQAANKTHSGYAAKSFASAASPQSVCEFFSSELSADGWVGLRNDCNTAAQNVEQFSDTSGGHMLLEFSKQGIICRVSYNGYAGQGKKKYTVLSEWGARP